MIKQKKVNRGFSFIELLIAMTIFSIVMLMVVQFMSTTSGAYHKTKKNLNIQTEAMQVTEQMSDILMQASYVRIHCSDKQVFDIQYDKSTDKNRNITSISSDLTDYDLVSDNYGNYVKSGDPFNLDYDVNINFDTYDLVDDKGKKYPTENTDMDYKGVASNRSVKSFRKVNSLMPDKDTYIKPKYIYIEYRTPTTKTNVTEQSKQIQHVLFEIDNQKKIFMCKYESTIKTNGFDYAITKLNELKAKNEGLLTKNLTDFYLSPDVDGNSFKVNMMFEDGGYKYNSIETIKFRNSNVLTVKPQKLFKVK